ncbi:hypothetical protein SK3146_00932 [Paenibacillus konkukensis]|uniref:Uncharacterized protein n=2 Tax=Paenibacillus TaxID=44249 RepID=A0ABY4RIT3_9BACL|nr:hypothetical protein SK3146_00932 [Paenibacillus konkukensis]
MNEDEKDLFNETSYTVAGINTPADQENCTATDMLSDAVAEMMNRIEEDFIGEPEQKSK